MIEGAGHTQVVTEDVLRRKLLVDGDGQGDDRRIVTLLRSFSKWCAATNETPEESELAAERMCATLAQCEAIMVKSRLTNRMNQSEMKNYESLCENIEQMISEAHKKIDSCKIYLQQAKRIRKNRQEYDVLAKVIQQHPDRQETIKKLDKLGKELNELRKTKDSLDGKLNMRRKHFAVLRNSIHELELLLNEDEDGDNDEPAMKREKMDS